MSIKYISEKRRYFIINILSIFVLIVTFSTTANAQSNVNYGYDDNGNRFVSTITSVPPVIHRDTNNCSTTISVYPNPSYGHINISISSFQCCNLAMFYGSDATGKLLFTQNVTSTMTTLNLSNYNQGLFYLRVVMCSEEYSFKLIKLNPGQGQPLAPFPVSK